MPEILALHPYIDHTNLSPEATDEDFEKLCLEAVEYNFKAVCIPPYAVEPVFKIRSQLKGKFSIATVVGFPLGYNDISVKTQECKQAIEDGADEIDYVVNISAIKSGRWDLVQDEMDRLITYVNMKAKTLKVIFETARLNRKEIKQLCEMCIESKVHFAKTSTGFGPSGADVKTVEYMKSILKNKVAIKASGGIKTREDALMMIEAGASRIGTSYGLKIVK